MNKEEKKPINKSEEELFTQVIEIKRVSKKTEGGNQISFTALVVTGDRNGRVGLALGKGPDVASAVAKGKRKAAKLMVEVGRRGTTIPHDITKKVGSAKVFLKPAPAGSGLIAAQTLKPLLEAAGIKDISVKILGANNKRNNLLALLEALKELKAYVA